MTLASRHATRIDRTTMLLIVYIHGSSLRTITLRKLEMQLKNLDSIKANGIHYTPAALAQFLANVVVKALLPRQGTISVLDPACGDGGLLLAFTNAVPLEHRNRLVLEGYETDCVALENAEISLRNLGVENVILRHGDFLNLPGMEDTCQRSLFTADAEASQYDAVIANPPYVRTQVLGAKEAQRLATRFKLSGRVDLYHAFASAMIHVLKPNGVLGLLTSNRFLTIKSGTSLRKLLRSRIDLHDIYDLGDTKLFSAAVLPAIVVGRKGRPMTSCKFSRVYKHRENGTDMQSAHRGNTVLDALQDGTAEGLVQTNSGTYRIERGVLQAGNGECAWSLTTDKLDSWLATICSAREYKFGEIAKIRVGIKTTADDVFIRSDWSSLPAGIKPEDKLLYPLITHHEAKRWLASTNTKQKQVLYPHYTVAGKRAAINLTEYPRAAAYLNENKARLERRQYVISSGRRWYEIWVPHQCTDWLKPKIAFPDIAEEPRFFLDMSGSIVNGDCYWMVLNDGVPFDYLLLMLAGANSSFITRYYDTRFHNKLYAGRRRFMTQYVEEFPVPRLDSPIGMQIIHLLENLRCGEAPNNQTEEEIDRV